MAKHIVGYKLNKNYTEAEGEVLYIVFGMCYLVLGIYTHTF